MDLWEEAAREAALRAAGGPPRSRLPGHIEEAVRRVSEALSYRGSCPLCGRSVATPRGYYMHLTRSHLAEIAGMVRSVSEGLSEGRRRGVA
jgi:hypothetical protein